MANTDNFGFSNLIFRIFGCRKRFFAAIFFLVLFIAGTHTNATALTTPPGVPDLSNDSTYLKVIADSAIADNSANDRIRAHIVDSDGNPVPGINVNFRWNPGTGDVTIGVTTDVNGNAFLQLASAIVGKIAVNARINGVLLVNGNPINASFVAYVPSVTAPTTKLVVVANGAVANGTAINTVKAIVTDANGNPVPNQSVTFQKPTGVANFTTPVTVVTDANGEAFISMSSTTVGDVTITADVNGVQITNNSPATVKFVADVPNVVVASTFLEVVTSGALANGSATNSVRAHITDINGNPAANQTVTFTIASGTANPSGSLTVITDANGYALLNLTSTVANTAGITAVVNGINITNGSPASVTFVVDVPSVNSPATKLVVVTTGALSDGTATNSVRAIITDANGNPVSGQTVTFQIASGTATFTTPVTVTTDINGQAIVSLVSTTAGTVAITANVNGTPITNNSPASVVFVANAPDVSKPSTLLEVLTTGALADGTATNSVRAHITDVNGNPVPGQTVTFTIASGVATPSGSLTMVTDANGNAMLVLTSNTIGNVNITATVNGNNIPNGSPATVVFVADVPSVSVATTKLVVITTGAVANGIAINTVKAIITDKNGNPVPGQTVAFTMTPGTAIFVGAPQLITDANGEAIINIQSTVSGSFDITATVNLIPITNGSPATVIFVAGLPDLTNPLTALKVTKDSSASDGAATDVVKAHIVDAFGNPVPGQTVTFTVAGGIATPTGLLTFTTDANGDAIISFTSVVDGNATITAKLNTVSDITYGSPATITFVTYPDVTKPATILVVMTDNAVADGLATNSIRAHVVDNNGNVMPGQKVVFTITSGDGTITTIQPVVTDANGDAVIMLVSSKVGSVAVTAKVEGKDIINGSPAKVRFTADDVWVPRVFTPNGDGTNDIIRPIINGSFQFQFFSIYNRWGNQLFNSIDVNKGWDGKLKGVLQPNETYLWIIGGTNANNVRVQKRGMFTLVR